MDIPLLGSVGFFPGWPILLRLHKSINDVQAQKKPLIHNLSHIL